MIGLCSTIYLQENLSTSKTVKELISEGGTEIMWHLFEEQWKQIKYDESDKGVMLEVIFGLELVLKQGR